MLSSETGNTPSSDSNGTPRKSPAQSPKPPPRNDTKVNPLEKIEQLLTCSICLDRYKNPKLLPCQHTYCLPCLDNYVDTVHHNLKCPECRSEHSIPFEGAKGFPTNLTLTSFLDIHLEATDDNSEEIEAYINRYNMERCKICDEKAELDTCYHCDRKTCKECRNAHMEMLKRDLGRLLNQVRRLQNRVKEASDSVAKNIQQLDSNIQSTQTEVHDYFQRYQNELKKREDYFIGEVDLFSQNEKRLMNSVKEVLDAEYKNLTDSCEWVESALNGGVSVKDDELCRYKTILVEGVESLRGFKPDTEEYFTKKLRFNIEDASKLPAAICNFGELTVLLPQFAGRYLPLEQHYLPKSLRLGFESDSYKTSLRTALEENQLKMSKYKRQTDDTFSTPRSRRALQLDDDSNSWSNSNRLRVGANENGRSSPLNSATNSTNSTSSSLLGRSSYLPPTVTSTIVTELEEPAGSSTKNTATPNLLTRRNQNRNSMVLPETKASSSAASVVKKEEAKPVMAEKQISTESNSETKGITLRQKPPLPRQQSSNDSNGAGSRLSTPTLTEQTAGGPKRRSLIIETTNSSSKATNGDLTPTRRQKFKIICRSTSSNPMKRSDSADSLDLASGTTLTSALTTTAVPRPSNGEQKHETTGRSSSGAFAPYSSSTNFSDYPVSPTMAASAAVAQTVARLRSQDRMDSNDSDESPPLTPKSRTAWMERRRQKFLRSRTNPDIFGTMDPADRAKLKASTNQVPSTTSQLSARVQQLLTELDFKNALAETSSTTAPRASSTVQTGETDSSLTDSRSRFARRTSIIQDRDFSTERARSRPTRPTSTLLNTPIFNYGTKSKPRLVFGRRGDEESQFNWPRGVVVLPGSELAIVDSANHRIQIFNKNGKLLRQFGSYGTGNGQLDNCADVAYNRNKHQLIVSDRYNCRIQTFDIDGKFIKSFGGNGSENGKLKEPHGVAVDDLGQIFVVDKGNNRIQVFDSNGNYIFKFGSKGDALGQFNSPLYIAIHRRTQNLFISDTGNHRISVHDHQGVPILSFGVEGFHTGQLKMPRGVAIDTEGFVVVADSGNNRIQVFTPDGQFHHGFGTWGTNLGQLKGVEGVALLETEQQIICTDRENHRIQIF